LYAGYFFWVVLYYRQSSDSETVVLPDRNNKSS
jgi:hypothetical protein